MAIEDYMTEYEVKIQFVLEYEFFGRKFEFCQWQAA